MGFVTNDIQNPTHYRVEIYDENDGSWSGVTNLQAGETPFTTDEDNSEDFFAPIRTQSGTLQICTVLDDGSRISLEELLPANNIARPVRVWKIGQSSNTIEWQGFLSCEAYSQNYTEIPENLSLSLIGVLEAMASVQLDQSHASGLATIRSVIKMALGEIMLQSDMGLYEYINYSYTPSNILDTYIDQTLFFNRNEYNNENSTTYIVSGMSVKEVLEYIAVYMGWIIRERGTTIYFTRLGDDIKTIKVPYSEFDNPSTTQDVNYFTQDLATDVEWMGSDHKCYVSAGAKSVEVVASLKKYNVNIQLPEFPVGNVQQYSNTQFITITSAGGGYGNYVNISSICNKNYTFTNLCEFNCFEMANNATVGRYTTVENVLSCALLNPSADPYGLIYNDGTRNYFYNHYIGAFMAKVKVDSNDYVDGLYIVGMREAYQLNPISSIASRYLFSIKSLTYSNLSTGSLKLKCNAITIYSGDTGRVWADYTNKTSSIWICLKFGDKYWNGSSWSSSFSYFHLMANELTIPINTMLSGEVIIRLYGYDSDFIIPADQEQGFASDMFISELSVDYVPTQQTDLYSDRSENHYYRLLGTNFRDEISIGTNLVTYLNNLPSPSLVLAGTGPGQFMTAITYYLAGGETELRRPEVDLLNRLAAYYGAARQRLELEVAHPTAAPLPLLRLNGINDGKKYLPLSESRDWKTDVCTVTCFETPFNDEPSEL